MTNGKDESKFWKRYRQNTAAWWATWAFSALMLVSAAANIIANDRPIVLHWDGSTYFPAFTDYLPRDFGKDGFVVDYFVLAPEIASHGWALWPPIQQRPFEENLNFDSLPAPPGASSVIGKDANFPGREVHHILGTDTAGRDLLTRLIYGCRTSLLMAMATTLLALVVGVAVGAFMGYFGGWFDILLGRVLETLGHFPVIFMIIILNAFLERPSIGWIIGIFVVLDFPTFAFYMRGQVLSARKLTYVEAAQALGQTDRKVMFRHILPNVLGPIMVLIPFNVTSDIQFLATIDFLGFGVQPPTSSLGAILRSGFDLIEQRWFLIEYSSLVLVAILILVNFIGDGVRDGLDPHASLSRKDYKRWVKSLGKAASSP